MASDYQIRGLLLEETILSLLRAAGYQTVNEPGGDPTLQEGPAGLVVAGRGTGHQIDAIADFRIGPPFSNPQRLLVEAKYYGNDRRVSLPIVRNAVGVLKDVSEFWVRADRGKPAARRYHYQAAVFSSSPFTKDAQDYAFAHDIYLLPLRESPYFEPVLQAIATAVGVLPQTPNGQVVGVDLTSLRKEVRRRLQPQLIVMLPHASNTFPWIDPIVRASSEVGQGLIGTIARAFPIFLIPRPGLALSSLADVTAVTIHFRREAGATGWTLTRIGETEPLFTFDLPKDLFKHYANDGVLSPERAVDMKAEYLREIQAIHETGEHPRLLTFRLDLEWLASVRQILEARR